MNAIRIRKHCWNCEGEVHVQSFQCHHCGSDLTPQEQENDAFAPPYQSSGASSENSSIPKPPYPMNYSQQELTVTEEEWNGSSSSPTEQSSNMEKSAKTLVLTLVLLTTGSVFFLFSLVLLLFSNDGILTLRWNSEHWPLYLIVSLVSLFYGLKNLGQIKE
ncbi:MAG: hypothetical protein ACI9S8_000570 [Chlamydiales bacterium]|jgi:hypothetical protein